MTTYEHQNSTPSSFRSKLGSYVTGLAIGFLLLGFFMYQKHRSEQREAIRVEQLQNQHENTGVQPPAGQTP